MSSFTLALKSEAKLLFKCKKYSEAAEKYSIILSNLNGDNTSLDELIFGESLVQRRLLSIPMIYDYYIYWTIPNNI